MFSRNMSTFFKGLDVGLFRYIEVKELGLFNGKKPSMENLAETN